MADERGPKECGPIELRIELPEGDDLRDIEAALLRAAQDPRFVESVKDFFATCQNQAALATIVRQGGH